MPTAAELIALREKIDEEEKNKGSAEEERRKLVIRKHKEFYNKEPTEEEIKSDLDFLERCRKRI